MITLPRRILLSMFVCCSVSSVQPASAHPHVWVGVRSEVIYAPDGSVKGIRHAWTFDDLFSTYATQGLTSKERGRFTREELAPLARVNVESLKEFDYFTFATIDGEKAAFAEPIDYFLDFDSKKSVLTLHFMLPLKASVKAKKLEIDIYDPTYFIEFGFVEKNPATLIGPPRGCGLKVRMPQEMNTQMSRRLSQLPPGAQVDPSAWLSNSFANRISVKCP
jgi:ABC-type uncharacterized transport system substrate-binding protein